MKKAHFNKLMRDIVALLDSHRELLSADEIETLEQILECLKRQRSKCSSSTVKKFLSKDEVLKALAFVTRFLIEVFHEE